MDTQYASLVLGRERTRMTGALPAEPIVEVPRGAPKIEARGGFSLKRSALSLCSGPG